MKGPRGINSKIHNDSDNMEILEYIFLFPKTNLTIYFLKFIKICHTFTYKLGDVAKNTDEKIITSDEK